MSTDDDDISRLYQQSKDQQPPAHVDDAILSAAKDALSGQAQTHTQENTNEQPASKGPFSGGWPAAVSIAAVLVITVILVPTIQREQPTETASMKPDDTRLMEQESFDRVNSPKAKQRTISIQNKPEKETGKALTVQDTATESTAYERKRLPAVERYNYEEDDTATKRKPHGLNNLMSIQKSEPAALPARSSGQVQDQIIAEELLTDDELSHRSSPETWLKKIRELIEQGDIKSARKELDDFKIEYPDEEIEQSILDSFDDALDDS